MSCFILLEIPPKLRNKQFIIFLKFRDAIERNPDNPLGSPSPAFAPPVTKLCSVDDRAFFLGMG